MIRIGVVNIDVSQPLAFSQILNQEDRARYVAVYNDGFRSDEEVDAFIRKRGLECRCKTVEELAEKCDIGFIQGCNWDKHLDYVEPFMKLGKPVFLDKPMVGSMKDIRKLEELMRKGLKVVGSSSLRYADELMAFADELEKADDFETALSKLIRRELAAHKRILFNGNGYSAEWPIEAEKRGLLNLRSTPEALLRYTEAKNVALFARHGIYTETEIKSRQDINMEEYAKVIHIEALTSLDMLGKMIVPACAAYSKMLAEGVAAKKSIGVDAPAEVAAVRELTDKTAELMALEEKLKDAVAGEPEELNERAMYEHETVIPAMEAARKVADELELKVGKAYWPMPTYADLLFYV